MNKKKLKGQVVAKPSAKRKANPKEMKKVSRGQDSWGQALRASIRRYGKALEGWSDR